MIKSLVTSTLFTCSCSEYTFALYCNRVRPKSKLLYSIVQNQPGECEVALFAAQFKVCFHSMSHNLSMTHKLWLI